MKILALSDSHGRSDNLGRAVELNHDVDAIIHLGDGYRDLKYVNLPDVPIYRVRGNGEEWFSMRENNVPRELFLEFDGVKILIMHGHTHSIKSGFDGAIEYALERDADILLFGHTHTALERYIPEGTSIGRRVSKRGLYLFNPGSIGEPRFSEATFGLITIRNGEILLSHGEI